MVKCPSCSALLEVAPGLCQAPGRSPWRRQRKEHALEADRAGVSLAPGRQVPQQEDANMVHGPAEKMGPLNPLSGRNTITMSQMVKPYPSHSAPHHEGAVNRPGKPALAGMGAGWGQTDRAHPVGKMSVWAHRGSHPAPLFTGGVACCQATDSPCWASAPPPVSRDAPALEAVRGCKSIRPGVGPEGASLEPRLP